jgi:hypothetical protein
MLYASYTEYSLFYVVVRENKVMLRIKKKMESYCEIMECNTVIIPKV